MRKTILSILTGIAALFTAQTSFAQACTPVSCISTLPAYGGICDTILLNGRVGNAYSDFESFHITTACFDAVVISPANAGTNIRIVRVDNFTYTGLPTGLTAAANQGTFSAPSNGCIRVSGTPTVAGVFAVTANFLADINAFPFGCGSFPIAQNDNAASYALDLIVLPKPDFTIPKTSFCANEPAVTLSLAANSTTGGTFSGPGVFGSTFDPNTAGVGTHTIKYRVTAQQGAAIGPATDSFSITVTVNPNVSTTLNSTNQTCAAGGTVTNNVTGGTAPFTYVWNNGATAASLSNLGAGSYQVTVTDAAGCSVSNSASVSSSVVILNTNSPVTTNSICGGATGSASVTATNGTAPYTYAWSNGGNTQTINNIAAGSYNVTITDANSCQGVVSGIVVNNPNSPSASISSSTNVNCNGASTGTASVSATGGTVTTGYSYNWSNNANTSSISGLTAGVYTVTVTDNAQCTDIVAVVVSQPTAVTISASSTNVLCFGQSTGSVAVSVSGGTPNYTYNWNNGNNTSAQNNIPAGTYTLTVTDDNNCVSTQQLSVTQPAASISFNPVTTNILCFGAGNGTVALNATGGSGILTYNWSNGSTDPSLSLLQAGTYSCTVTDANGCVATSSSFVVTEPSALNVSSTVTDASTFGSSDGSVNITVSGGTASYTYNWSNGANTEDLNNVAAGEYTVTITDANNCSFIQTETVDQPSSIYISGSLGDLALYPNPGENILYIESNLLTGIAVNVQMFSVDGKIVKSETIIRSFGLIELNTVELPSGVYFITLKTEKGNSSLKWIKK
jgi:trimeric autotransporter adhesin